MERRFFLFLVCSFLVLATYFPLMSRLQPKPPQPPEAVQAPELPGPPKEGQPKPPKEKPAKPPEKPAPGKPSPEKPPAEKPTEEPKPPEIVPREDEEKYPTRWVTLGSADPKHPYRMLVTLTSKGAAVVRVELSSERYRELEEEDRSGYLGHVVVDEDVMGSGCPVQVVGAGTPAAKAGLKPGDLIKEVNGDRVTGAASLRAVLKQTRPGKTVELGVQRQGAELRLQAELTRRPLEVIKPEGADPRSFLLTLRKLGGQEVPPEDEMVALGEEIKGLNLWNGNWELVQPDQNQATFRRRLKQSGLELTKTYRLATVPHDELHNQNCRAYHLELTVEIRNSGQQAVAYQLDGPNGLPTEGYWYASKVSSASGSAGMRDLVVSWDQATPSMVNCPAIAENKGLDKPWRDQALTYLGVDAQYFAAVMVPQMDDPREIWFDQVHPLRVGAVDEKNKNLTNISFRLVSKPLAAGGTLEHKFVVFAGPKRPDLLAQYGLKKVVYYGWPIFAFVAKPLVDVLHVLHWAVPNWGLAVILLTVLVRGCMFPISRKQALNAQKMQELQPKIKEIHEKYKKDMEARTKAQQELFRQHNYNPLSGCLVLFIQLPIFIGLYRALMVDVELRQAPLIRESIFWCSNLAAPDMLYNWSWFMPAWVNSGAGMFGLGPYLNVLPFVTIALFIWQQKMFMPPPTDEQSALQQKIMKYMMIFMGILFYKVASGLCIYFIASSLWGLAERKLLPKAASTPAAAAPPQSRAEAKAAARSQPERKSVWAIFAKRDGSAEQKKKKKRGWK